MSLATLNPFPSFEKRISDQGLDLSRTSLNTLQINIGKRCNQACHHCHVEAGPKRTENMELETVERLLDLLRNTDHQIQTVDITGGAPELNPHFRYLVKSIRQMGIEVLDRCNLTVFFESGQEDTPDFLREHRVQIIASLPCYSQSNVDQQRGNGVFDQSILALKRLNEMGYGKPATGLLLHLVYNPLGAFLPPGQKTLEEKYKAELKKDLGIEFNNLFTITNMPIKRFLRDLERDGKLEEYMDLLTQSFNPGAAENIMCRNLVSIGWDGQIYDCDFNQMLEIPLSWRPRTIWQIDNFSEISDERIAFANHCFGCTAGAGSSCGGATT